jgi:peptide deformylase
MAIRDIVLYAKNEAALRKKSAPVRMVNRRIKKLIRDLKETLAQHPEGIGLAAPQINVHQRVVLVWAVEMRTEKSLIHP